MRIRLLSILVGSWLAMTAAACGADADPAGGGTVDIAVSTALLGDVVTELVGDEAAVTVVMPRGADPHNFQPSAQEVAALSDADVLVVNGAGFEEGLQDTLQSVEASGVPVFSAIDAVEPLDHDAGEHDDGDHDDEGHDHGGVDPHFFTDPARMATAVTAMTAFLTEKFPELDLETRADTLVDELLDLDAEVEATLSDIPEADRILVTNHEVLGYFADRYDFEIVGTLIPSASTGDAVSARDLDALADIVVERGVPAVFAETSSPTELADALAAEAGTDVSVVELYTEALGEPGSDGATYLDMVRTNATRIADALLRRDA